MSDAAMTRPATAARGAAAAGLPDHPGYRRLGDEELRHGLGHYRPHLALVGEDDDDPAVREGTRAFLARHVAAAEAGEGRRRRAARLGAPRDADLFPAAWLADLKRRVALDAMAEYELGARLGLPARSAARTR